MGPLGLALSGALALTIAGPASHTFLPLSLAGLPIGSLLQHQKMACRAALPAGLAFSRLRTITVGGCLVRSGNRGVSGART